MREMAPLAQTPNKQAYSILEFCQAFGIGRSTLYDQIRNKRLQVVKVGARTLIPRGEAERWLADLRS